MLSLSKHELVEAGGPANGCIEGRPGRWIAPPARNRNAPRSEGRRPAALVHEGAHFPQPSCQRKLASPGESEASLKASGDSGLRRNDEMMCDLNIIVIAGLDPAIQF